MTNTQPPSNTRFALHQCVRCQAHYLFVPGAPRECHFCVDEILKPRTINTDYLSALVGWCYCSFCGTMCNLPHRHNTTCMYCGMGSLTLITPDTLLRINTNPTPEKGTNLEPLSWLP